jgi:transcriptional regulator with XRE-family HTH domain
MAKRVKVFRGERLKDQRESLGLSQEDLAARLQLAQPSLADYENKKTEPSPALITRMAKELGVTTDYLLGLTDNRHQELRISDLSPEDQDIFDALREGKGYEAIRIIAERQQSISPLDKQGASSPRGTAQR